MFVKSLATMQNQCPNKKKGKKKDEIEEGVVASAKAEEYTKKFEKEFSLVSTVSDSNISESVDT